MAEAPDLAEVVKQENVLHFFRSHNYNFTLSCMTRQDLVDPQNYGETIKKYVVASSKGKGSNGGINSDIDISKVANDLDAQKYIDKFTSESPGRFDFYFESAEVKNNFAHDQRSGFSKASKVDFTLVEPYGIGGLFESMQACALAAGHPSYITAPWMLTVDFMGYPDWQDLPDAVQVEYSTRYFSLSLRTIELKASAAGTKYIVHAIPINEIAFGHANILKASINIKGDTVGDILQDFVDKLNANEQASRKVAAGASSDAAMYDEYQISFPSLTDGNLVFDDSGKIKSSKVSNLSTENTAYAFLDPVDEAERKAKGSKVKFSPKDSSVQFSQRANIHDCIAAIIRDSDYTNDILKNLKEDGMIDYFTIGVEIEIKDGWDAAAAKPFYLYKFYVAPYKIHSSRIPGYANTTSDLTGVSKRVNRTYNYYYSGKNVDVLNFDIKLNYGFYQVATNMGGNNPILDQNLNGSLQGINRVGPLVNSAAPTPAEIAQGTGDYPIAILTDPDMANVNNAGESTQALQADPYANFIKGLHKAILTDPKGFSKATIEVLGDPYYLLQAGLGNIRPTTNDTYPGITDTGDVNALIADVFIEVNWQNVEDLQKLEDGGLVSWSKAARFSGLYQVTSVNSKFSEGRFKQILEITRILGQPADTGKTEPGRPNAVWVTDTAPAESATPPTPPGGDRGTRGGA